MARRSAIDAAGLALEIEDHEIVLGPEDLAEVVIAMDPDLDQVAPIARKLPHPGHEPGSHFDHLLGQDPSSFGHRRELCPHGRQHPAGVLLEVVGHRGQLGRGQGLGGEGRLGRIAGEGQMHLAGAGPEHGRRAKRCTDDLEDVRRGLLIAKLDERA